MLSLGLSLFTGLAISPYPKGNKLVLVEVEKRCRELARGCTSAGLTPLSAASARSVCTVTSPTEE